MTEILVEIHQIIPAQGWHFYNKSVARRLFEPILCFALVSVQLSDDPDAGLQKKLIGLSALDADLQQLLGLPLETWRTSFMHASEI